MKRTLLYFFCAGLAAALVACGGTTSKQVGGNSAVSLEDGDSSATVLGETFSSGVTASFQETNASEAANFMGDAGITVASGTSFSNGVGLALSATRTTLKPVTFHVSTGSVSVSTSSTYKAALNVSGLGARCIYWQGKTLSLAEAANGYSTVSATNKVDIVIPVGRTFSRVLCFLIYNANGDTPEVSVTNETGDSVDQSGVSGG